MIQLAVLGMMVAPELGREEKQRWENVHWWPNMFQLKSFVKVSDKFSCLDCLNQFISPILSTDLTSTNENLSLPLTKDFVQNALDHQ